ncbi:hypothetical protein [Stutzerimonas chloritidismutans]|uniref:hypothetical protein n=1 Tax=Stutzerimonas chloritidismutans TaxID=203192 RepID=UPI00384D7E01
MTTNEDFTPTTRKPKRIKIFLVVDMWEIDGFYGDGKWHKLINQFAEEWAAHNRDQEPATLWAVVRPCDIFDNGTSCYMTSSSKLPGTFFDKLASYMKEHCGPHFEVLDVDFELPFRNIEGWRAYLHFEQGKLWEPNDEGGWCERV